MASNDEILRIRRTDDPSAHLLLKVTHTANDSRPLDLKLVATEHEHLYHASIKTASAASYRANNSHSSDEEWRDTLVFALRHKPPDAISFDALQCLEIVAAIADETCTITIRRIIGGITTRLGAINLDQDDEREEVNAFEWVDSAVSASDEVRSRLDTLQKSVQSYQDHVAKLTSQLDKLVKAKKDHEDQLLQKFAALLNAKKLKIRDQQRLLNGSQIKSGTAAAVHGSRNGSSKREAASSRQAKRKASGLSSEEEDLTALYPDVAADDDLADDDLDDDALAEEEEEGQRTPDQESTADDASDAEGFAPAPVMATSRHGSQRMSRSQTSAKDSAPMDVDDGQELPPIRKLPFARPKQGTEKPASPAPAAEQDEDETDDEL